MWRTRLRILIAIFPLMVGSASAKDVVIVTSFPKELFETYKKTFEAKHPGTNVVVNSKPTPAGVTYLRETKAKPEADIFWVSAPDAFQTLDSDGLLEKYAPPKEIMAKIPAKIGNFPDPRSRRQIFWLRHQRLRLDVEQKLSQSAQTNGAERMDRSDQLALLQSPDYQRAVAQRHNSFDHRNHSASLRLGQRLGACCSTPAATWAASPSAASASRKR